MGKIEAEATKLLGITTVSATHAERITNAIRTWVKSPPKPPSKAIAIRSSRADAHRIDDSLLPMALQYDDFIVLLQLARRAAEWIKLKSDKGASHCAKHDFVRAFSNELVEKQDGDLLVPLPWARGNIELLREIIGANGSQVTSRTGLSYIVWFASTCQTRYSETFAKESGLATSPAPILKALSDWLELSVEQRAAKPNGFPRLYGNVSVSRRCRKR